MPPVPTGVPTDLRPNSRFPIRFDHGVAGTAGDDRQPLDLGIAPDGDDRQRKSPEPKEKRKHGLSLRRFLATASRTHASLPRQMRARTLVCHGALEEAQPV
jgi:hypothetical protein